MMCACKNRPFACRTCFVFDRMRRRAQGAARNEIATSLHTSGAGVCKVLHALTSLVSKFCQILCFFIEDRPKTNEMFSQFSSLLVMFSLETWIVTRISAETAQMILHVAQGSSLGVRRPDARNPRLENETGKLD